MIWRRFLCSGLSAILFTGAAGAQEEQETVLHNNLSFGPSYAKVITGGGETASLGLDYLYRFNPKWELGVQFDFNYDTSFDEFESWAIVPIVTYSITEGFPIFVGAGIEHRRETDEDEFLLRAGFEYAIPLGKSGHWDLLPGGFVDYIDNEWAATVVVAVGYSW